MKNYWNKLRYIIINTFHLHLTQNEYPDYDIKYVDEFHTMENWKTIHPETTIPSKTNGATFQLVKIDNKHFIYPTIISKITVKYGGVLIKAKLSQSPLAKHKFFLSSEKEKLGFLIVNNYITIVCKSKSKWFKLYNPDKEHGFEIEINPVNKTIYWRIDDVTVHEEPYTNLVEKRVMIEMPATHHSMNVKELPISFNLKSVEFFEYNPIEYPIYDRDCNKIRK